ncbi:FAD-binding domain-containing protein [Psychrosphaera sp. 1_MG-2023]|uniref:cryptochrome/photolyase family protein n=1 Tax=Psychrosphaera sp. 1_MG-2023 TaxID=3062643 RepID=UPI0026E28133|nr:FAD-binding domain-containing protein [Psychrosphaera sp. 1_MG-2023]MDO6721300.1 FAD-binding domain-containing protein [Psychrosphaera sp. 1_MG-2023]
MNNHSIIWFRNDLRVDDNPALQNALSANTKLALFFNCEPQWRKHQMAEVKINFIHRHVQLLKAQLAQLGIELLVIDTTDFNEQHTSLAKLCEQHDITTVYANSELELNEQVRDNKIIKSGINLHLTEADTIVPKGIIKNKQGEMYRVFSAYRRIWLEQVQMTGFSHFPLENHLTQVNDASDQNQLSSKWPLANEVEQTVLPKFFQTKLANYKVDRDIPGVKGTSGLSPYLAIGAISARSVLKRLMYKHPDILYSPDSAEFSWLNELIWRDFYRHLLFHFPDLIKGRSFNAKYDQLQWPPTETYFQLWRDAKTGFPIIDAAMRQLQQTGWMHNRLRMIVASFLTKNLLVNWRLGEAYFMQQLIDGDFAANNGGWQWSAGTGCDAQPYFRVFNPQSQSKKFDPSGKFIRTYLPELRDVPDKYIHAPFEYLIQQGQADKYWPEIVDLKSSRVNAIEFYGMK